MSDLVPREWAAILPLIVLMVWMGMASQTFMPPISATNARIVERTEQGVVFHVKNSLPQPGKEAAHAR